MDVYVLELVRWVQNVEMRLFKGQTLDEETALFRIRVLKLLNKHNELVMQLIEQNKIVNRINLRKLRDAKKANKKVDPPSGE